MMRSLSLHHYLTAVLLLALTLCSSRLSAQEPETASEPLTKECIDEPIFKGRICLYHNGVDKARENVVFVHGINGNAMNWRNQIAPLQAHYNLLLIDLPGFGDSSKNGGNYSPDDYARVLHYVIHQHLDEPFHLVGHSLGGAVALLYTAYYPDDVKRLLATDVAGVLHKIAFTKSLTEGWITNLFGDTLGRFLRDMTGEWMGRLEEMRPPDSEIRLDASYDPSDIAIYALIDTNFAPYLAKITQPVLLVWHEGDTVAPLRTGEALAARLEQSYLEVIPGDGHSPMEDAPALFNAKLIAFLNASTAQLHEAAQQYKNSHPSAPKTAWQIECHDKRGLEFEGDFERLELYNCANIHIINSNIGELKAYESRFEMVNSRVGSAAIEGSEAMITASRFDADTPLTLSRSRVDLAGVVLHGNSCSIRTTRPSQLVFSISEITSARFTGPMHDLIQLGEDGCL